jgi:hypothetical protein
MADEKQLLRNSGVLADFVLEKRFTWTHTEWLDLLSRLRTTGFSANEADVGQALEKERERLQDNQRACCSFCGRSVKQVRVLISTPEDFARAYICDKCVETCIQLIGGCGVSAGGESVLDLSGLGITPPFRIQKFELDQTLCFHLCPFAQPFNDIYRRHVVGIGGLQDKACRRDIRLRPDYRGHMAIYRLISSDHR